LSGEAAEGCASTQGQADRKHRDVSSGLQFDGEPRALQALLDAFRTQVDHRHA
jgi:hypothetical protein